MGGTVYNLTDEEKEISEWTRRSRKEGICGIVKCFNKPTTQCKKCTNYYCLEHYPSHIDLIPNGSDFEYNIISSNEGLDGYMD
jgi:ubiquinone/menaquinone biosynthesis C-methylase UbiE